MSNLVHEACIQARHDNMSLRQQARQIGNVEICAQEAAYLVEQNPSKTMGLQKEVNLVKSLPAEICLNVDGEDGLANGSLCINEELDFRVSGSKRCSIV